MLDRAASRTPTVKRCILCLETKPASDFYLYPYVTNQKKQSVRLDSRCKPCAQARRMRRYEHTREREIRQCREYREAHRPELAAQVRDYRQQNHEKLKRQRVVSEQKRRLRGYNNKRNDVKEVIEAAFELARIGDQYLDAYSGELIDRPTIDHIVPLSAGGAHTPENVCVTSFANNRSKRATPLLVWLARRAAKADAHSAGTSTRLPKAR